jgi:hypothetical protein
MNLLHFLWWGTFFVSSLADNKRKEAESFPIIGQQEVSPLSMRKQSFQISSLVKFLLSKKEGSLKKERLDGIKVLDAVYPESSPNDVWFNVLHYSSSTCSSGSAISVNALLVGTCINYIDMENGGSTSSLRLDCSSSSSKYIL